MHSHFQVLWFRVSTYEFRRNTIEPIMRHHDGLSHLPLKFICNLLDLLKIDLLFTDGRLLHMPHLMSGQSNNISSQQATQDPQNSVLPKQELIFCLGPQQYGGYFSKGKQISVNSMAPVQGLTDASYVILSPVLDHMQNRWFHVKLSQNSLSKH